jgi:hypothetical protein
MTNLQRMSQTSNGTLSAAWGWKANPGRARRLAAEIAMVWPSAFEEATRRYLEANLQVRL